MEQLAPLIAASINAGTPLLLAAIGLLINERSGVLNLGAEGMMLVSAIAGFAVGYATKSPLLGFAAGAVCGMLMAALFAWLALQLATNQVATGLALAIFGAGLSAFVGQRFVGLALPAQANAVPLLGDIPFIGPALFRQHWMSYAAFALCLASMWFLYRTRAGLVLRAVGESPESAHALGYSVRGIRLAALLFGGGCCGLAGAYMSLVYTPMWVEGLVAGRGWIALALTAFATWRPARVLLGSLLFGGVTIAQFYLQGMGVTIPSQILSMAPYLATIVVLALISRNPDWIRLNMPASLGKPFRPGAH
ncbi:ABC transporter permease [Herbaspirillum sp. WKF16]|uniref:ABC transporter permease n=1 Tax=Herbaspirillum sp. WKF16 TaxID=3028312 RepID=UPI0023A97EC5|nr:ABC transporter permease [Herbaspirillum sp. WKF16]WDZ95616.1 ABC transporter permease [Herbaspirillum sp. WKF16]